MDRELILRHLHQAERHIAEGERHILEQQKRIEELERDGLDTKRSLDILATFIESLRMHKQDRDRILRELSGN